MDTAYKLSCLSFPMEQKLVDSIRLKLLALAEILLSRRKKLCKGKFMCFSLLKLQMQSNEKSKVKLLKPAFFCIFLIAAASSEVDNIIPLRTFWVIWEQE